MNKLKVILLILSGILMIPLGILATFGAVWYVLPMMATTVIGTTILSIINTQTILWITIASAVLYLVLWVIQKILTSDLKAKSKNLFIHINTWLICLVAVALAVATFVLATPLVAEEVVFGIVRKIGVGVVIFAWVIYHMCADKISKIVNRRIQAYETAKEVNALGRGSVICTNILKLFEVLFPELILLGLMAICMSWNVAIYFVVLVVASVIPVIGNIEADFNTRKEIKLKNQQDHDKLVQDIANSINK